MMEYSKKVGEKMKIITKSCAREAVELLHGDPFDMVITPYGVDGSEAFQVSSYVAVKDTSHFKIPFF